MKNTKSQIKEELEQVKKMLDNNNTDTDMTYFKLTDIIQEIENNNIIDSDEIEEIECELTDSLVNDELLKDMVKIEIEEDSIMYVKLLLEGYDENIDTHYLDAYGNIDDDPSNIYTVIEDTVDELNELLDD